MVQQDNTLRVLDCFSAFKCIAQQCEDTCCCGWSVFVDRRTLELLDNEPDKALRARLDSAIERRSGPDIPVSAAGKLKFNLSTGRCPLLTPDNLCDLQRQRGDNFLGLTCARYPRQENIIDGVRECSFSLSCPEAARAVLLKKDPLVLTSACRPASRLDYLYHRELNTRADSSLKDGRAHFPRLRELVIAALQFREAPFPDRLLLIGVLCQQLDRLVANDQAGEIASTLEAFGQQLSPSSPLLEAMRRVPVNPLVQYELLHSLSTRYFAAGISHLRFAECARDAHQGLQGEDGRGEAYAKAFARHYLAFEPLHRHMLENWCVNEVVRTMFPFDQQGSIFDQYAVLALKVSMVKFYLIGLSAYHQGLSEDLVVKVIQSFSRGAEACVTFVPDVFGLLDSKQLRSLPALAILVKN